MANFKKIAVVADHRGEEYVPTAKKIIEGLGVECVVPSYDSGAENDYPDVVKSIGELFARGEIDGMVLLCGTGVGVNICANKLHGVRCVLAGSANVASLGRIHENCNALAMGVGYSSSEYKGIVVKKMCPHKMKKIITAFVRTDFGGGRHARRVEKLNNMN
jgi:ribose 5-phosphate isomerase B